MHVIILGGGLVGLTMANLLAQNTTLQITLIEAKMPELNWDPATHDLRCSAITLASQNIFKHLGVWQEILNHGVGYYDQMLVWEHDPDISINFSAKEVAQPELGHIVENRIIQRALWQKLQTEGRVRIVHDVVQNLILDTNVVRLDLFKQVISGDLLIGADGADSWLRKKLSMPVYTWPHQQKSLVATISCELNHNHTAMQRFTADGPLAFLPLAQDKLCSIVWTASPEKIERLIELDPQMFAVQLAQEFGFKVGCLKLEGERASFNLQMLHAKHYTKQRIVLIGDAAHVAHPLAGQGLNLGLLDAAALSEVLANATGAGLDVGQYSCVRKYERWRKGHNLGVLALVEILKRGFMWQKPWWQVIRSGGVRTVANFGLVKSAMIRYAMGLGGDLPKAACNLEPS